MQLRHLGSSGLALTIAGATLEVDPPTRSTAPSVITWSETERVAGARPGVLAATPVLAWLGIAGEPLDITPEGLDGAPGVRVHYAGFEVLAAPFTPIPWATPAEAVRKGLIGLRSPGLAVQRLSRTLRRPADPPLALDVRRGGLRVALLGQALHRFQEAAEIERLVSVFGGADVLVAGTDYDDEAATAALMDRFDARRLVLADLIGPVRRALGLPTRPIEHAANPRAEILREASGLAPGA